MCVGIILKDGRHLQSIEEIEKHFSVNLEPYLESYYPTIMRSACSCQIDLDRFMNEPARKDLFEYDYVEYWEL